MRVASALIARALCSFCKQALLLATLREGTAREGCSRQVVCGGGTIEIGACGVLD